MNIQQLRQSLKMKWLGYYAQNRPWLVKMRIWGTYDGVRRPCSGFMLATLSVLEPQFEQILDFITELSNNPDKIIAALGLNFSPDEELDLIIQDDFMAADSLSNEPLTEIKDRVQHVSLVTENLEDISNSPTRILNSEQPLGDMAPTKINVSSFTGANEVVRDRQPVTSVAVATPVSRESSATTLVMDKLASETIVQNQPERSLAISNKISKQGTTMLPSAMPTEIPQNYTSLKSLAVAIKIPSNDSQLKMQLPVVPTKTQISPSSNARSLASWVDEFCQGVDWNPEEAIYIHF
ncbi:MULTISPECIES: DUF5331 domain-containing protein [Calothrix]|uniref:DUF5331 domain-containing protein n=2 Tax=Calothrix TaxID=1186 RepID=A0ABR8AC80_9CYAN|nr:MULTISPECIES: DUF5331 domain-containing protein [Calothrix]MBD2197622.1 hypothetical protein [Calothrix parietina FACHB-288]MBD2227422.1 hypothetical protein [Calothrix anomala FACHB-343]